MKQNKLVINLFGAPGTKKTDIAAGIFIWLRKRDIDTQMVSDVATDIILEGRPNALEYQWYIQANQAYKIWCSYNHTQATIVDSPILLGPIYDKEASPALLAMCLELHHKYNNLNIVLPQLDDFEYEKFGKTFSITESASIHNRIIRLLDDNDISYIRYEDYGLEMILDSLYKQLQI